MRQPTKRPRKTTAEGLDSLKPDPLNARPHGEVNRGRIRDSLMDVGAGRSILINTDHKILAGNGVATEARALGMDLKIVQADRNTLVAVQRTDLTPDEEIRAALWDNRTTDEQGYNVEVIAGLAKTGHTKGIFSDAEVRAMKTAARKGGQRRHPDEIVKVRESVTVTLGDLFALGDHRLLCGDSTRAADVGRLMGDVRADLMVTDPPYGVQYGQGGADKSNAIRGDLSQAEIPVSFAVALDHALNADARIYVCGGSSNAMTYWKLFDHYLRLMPRIILWVKEAFLLRHNNYHSQFEFVYFGWKGKGGGSGFWFGDRKQSDVWQITRDPDYVHPTQKPVELYARALRNSCPPGGVLYEPFGGSGTGLIAAEQHGSRCYCLELDPRFVQAIIDRWEAFTERKATQLERGTG